MLERELKLFIPASQQSAVSTAMALLQPHGSIRLAAQYFDTAERDLARQGAALRLRLEGEQWVQTLKLRGQDELSVIEFNHPRAEPVLDLNLYNNTSATSVFSTLSSPLELRYQTDVQRTTATIKHGSTEVELALDLGSILAKSHELPISEIEFELKTGDMAEVFALAANWLTQFKLIIELRSKSERGALLYAHAIADPKPILKGAAAALAIVQSPYRLPAPTTPNQYQVPELYAKGTHTFLSQIIRNATLLACAEDLQTPKSLQASYLSLLRVGMRRLRSCRQLFKPWLSPAEKALAQQVRLYYQEFGLWRDKDMLWLELQPKLVTAGLPLAKQLEQPKNKKNPAQTLAASAEFQLFLLKNLASVILGQALIPTAYESTQAEQQLANRLNYWFKRIQQRSARFDQLSPERQHDLRNAIKRLRYSLEILGYGSTDPLYALLDQAQDLLGKLCDAYVAHKWYDSNNSSKAQKNFANDWLEQKIQKHRLKSKQTLLLLQEQRLSIPELLD